MPTILPITDFLDPQLDIYARLSENQLLNRCDPQNGIFIAESPKVIERALDAGCIPISFLTEDRHLENQALPFLERCPDIPFFSDSAAHYYPDMAVPDKLGHRDFHNFPCNPFVFPDCSPAGYSIN